MLDRDIYTDTATKTSLDTITNILHIYKIHKLENAGEMGR